MTFCCGPGTVKCSVMKVGAMEFKTPFPFFFNSLTMLKVKFVHGCLSSLNFSPEGFSYGRVSSVKGGL